MSIVRFCDWTGGKRCAKGLKPMQQRQPPVFKRHNDTINECWPDRERSRPSWCCLFQGLEAFEAQDVTTCAAKTSSAPIKSCKLACEPSNKGSRLDSVSRARPDASDSHIFWRQSSRQAQTTLVKFPFNQNNLPRTAICIIKLIIHSLLYWPSTQLCEIQGIYQSALSLLWPTWSFFSLIPTKSSNLTMNFWLTISKCTKPTC